MTSSSTYPTAIDDTDVVPDDTTPSGFKDFADLLADAVHKMQVELGTNPSGSADTVAALLNTLSAASIVLSGHAGKLVKVNDAGTGVEYIDPDSGAFPSATTKGTLAVYNGTAWVAIPPGTDGQLLSALASAGVGLSYIDAPSGGGGDGLPDASGLPDGTLLEVIDGVGQWAESSHAYNAKLFNLYNDDGGAFPGGVYTAVVGDLDHMLLVDSASDISFKIDIEDDSDLANFWTSGSGFEVLQLGAGSITFVGGDGTVLHSLAGNLKMAGQGAYARVWIDGSVRIWGDLIAA